MLIAMNDQFMAQESPQQPNSTRDPLNSSLMFSPLLDFLVAREKG